MTGRHSIILRYGRARYFFVETMGCNVVKTEFIPKPWYDADYRTHAVSVARSTASIYGATLLIDLKTTR